MSEKSVAPEEKEGEGKSQAAKSVKTEIVEGVGLRQEEKTNEVTGIVSVAKDLAGIGASESASDRRINEWAYMIGTAIMVLGIALAAIQLTYGGPALGFAFFVGGFLTDLATYFGSGGY